MSITLNKDYESVLLLLLLLLFLLLLLLLLSSLCLISPPHIAALNTLKVLEVVCAFQLS